MPFPFASLTVSQGFHARSFALARLELARIAVSVRMCKGTLSVIPAVLEFADIFRSVGEPADSMAFEPAVLEFAHIRTAVGISQCPFSVTAISLDARFPHNKRRE